MKTIGRWGYLIPVVWIVLGVLYARSLEAFAGIGVLIMVLISGAAIAFGVFAWRLTKKWTWGLVGLAVSGLIIFGLIVLSVRI